MKKKVYVGLSADIIHEGHINILKIANNLGAVTVGLLTDKAVSSYKKLPHLNYKQREIIVKNIRYVSKVIPQKSLSYIDNLTRIKPHYVVHGDDWKSGVQKKTRAQVISTLRNWGGRLIEPKYTKNISSTAIKAKLTTQLTPTSRVSILKRLLKKIKRNTF